MTALLETINYDWGWRDIRRQGRYTGTQEIERHNILGRHKTRLRDRRHKRHRKRALYTHIGNRDTGAYKN